MKKLLLLVAIIASLNASGQYTTNSLTTTLTPGNGDFLVDKSHIPFDNFFLSILSIDTTKVALIYRTSGAVFIPSKLNSTYIDGRSGVPFNTARLKHFYDSFMVSPAFTTSIAGDVNIISDTATQTIIIARLDSIAKYQTDKGVTASHIDSLGTLAIPAGSLVISGVRDKDSTNLVITSLSNTTPIEKNFINGWTNLAVPPQSLRVLATAHTITARVSCYVFILKLH